MEPLLAAGAQAYVSSTENTNGMSHNMTSQQQERSQEQEERSQQQQYSQEPAATCMPSTNSMPGTALLPVSTTPLVEGPQHRYSQDSKLDTDKLDPSHAVELSQTSLHKILTDLKTMCTKAYQRFADQTGQAACDPSEATVGSNPVLLYAVRVMHQFPWILATLNGAMPIEQQSEPGADGLINLPEPVTQPVTQPVQLHSAIPFHMSTPQLTPQLPLRALPPMALPDELVQAAEQQKVTSRYECQAAQGSIFGHKCGGLRNIAETLRCCESMTVTDTDTCHLQPPARDLKARHSGGGGRREFYETALKPKSLADIASE